MNPGVELTPRESDELCLRSAPATYLVFAIMLGAPALLLAIVALQTPSAWTGVAVALAGLTMFLVYFSYLRVVLSNGVLTQRSLFGRRSLPLKEVAKSRFEFLLGRNKGPWLVVTAVGAQQEFRIRLKPYRWVEVRALLAHPELKLENREHVA